jgi:hypothetical protein
MSDTDIPLPVAYCAPGRKVIAALTLMARGERYSDLLEHPFLEGHDDIWLVAPPEPLGLPPFEMVPPSALVKAMQEAEEERWLRFMSPAINATGAIISGTC